MRKLDEKVDKKISHNDNREMIKENENGQKNTEIIETKIRVISSYGAHSTYSAKRHETD